MGSFQLKSQHDLELCPAEVELDSRGSASPRAGSEAYPLQTQNYFEIGDDESKGDDSATFARASSIGSPLSSSDHFAIGSTPAEAERVRRHTVNAAVRTGQELNEEEDEFACGFLERRISSADGTNTTAVALTAAAVTSADSTVVYKAHDDSVEFSSNRSSSNRGRQQQEQQQQQQQQQQERRQQGSSRHHSRSASPTSSSLSFSSNSSFFPSPSSLRSSTPTDGEEEEVERDGRGEVVLSITGVATEDWSDGEDPEEDACVGRLVGGVS